MLVHLTVPPARVELAISVCQNISCKGLHATIAAAKSTTVMNANQRNQGLFAMRVCRDTSNLRITLGVLCAVIKTVKSAFHGTRILYY